MQNLPLLKNQAVRDLAWACFGPNLVDDFSLWPNLENIGNGQLKLTTERRLSLLELDQQPTPLLQHLMRRRSPRLGIYYESLWQFFIEQDPALELVASNLPVQGQHKTQGEFDLIYYDKINDQHAHLELALKFYLNTCAADSHFSDDFPHWLGPNCRDRFDIKLAHLLNHQIQLSALPESKKILRTLGVDAVSRHIALKGILFYPQTWQEPEPANTVGNRVPLSASHSRGTWLPLAELAEYSARFDKWMLLNKADWLSPGFCSKDETSLKLLNSSELADTVGEKVAEFLQPQMLCAMHRREGHYVEAQRLFITPNEWPVSSISLKRRK